jgi:deoxyribodipyrimidine photolyase
LIVYHVTTYKKLQKYLKAGHISPPVRAWETIEQAERMSLSTGRKIILRLRFPDNAQKLEGHFNQARVVNHCLPLNSM